MPMSRNVKIRRNSDADWQDYRWQEEPQDSIDVRLNLIRQYAQRSGGAGEIWFREVIQNSVDSGATEVWLATETLEDGRTRVRCFDNGSGMDLDTLKNVFLRMSGSKKEQGRSAFGGFGEAKKLILLAWKNYSVFTRKDGVTSEVEGSFKEAKYRQSKDLINGMFKTGTHIIVDCWTDAEIKSTGDYPERYALRLNEAIKYIGQCNLPKVNFTICNADSKNPPTQISPKMDLRSYKSLLKGEKLSGIDDIPICEIFVKKLATKTNVNHYSYIDFRTNGLKMFTECIQTGSIEYSIIVEIDTRTVGVKKVLTNNRDQIADTVLKEKISLETQAFTRDSTLQYLRSVVPKTDRTKGFGGVNANQRTIDLIAGKIELITHTSPGMAIREDSLEEACINAIQALGLESHPDSPIDVIPGLTGSLMAISIMSAKTGTVSDVISRYSKIPDYTYESYDMPSDFELEPKFKVKTMTKEVKRLLYAWTEVLRLVSARKGITGNFGVGFIASRDFIGMFIPNDQPGEYDCDGFVCLNPYKNGKLLDPSEMKDIKYMTKIAIHEMTHYLDRLSEHDAAFNSAVEDNYELIMPAFPLLVTICKVVGTSSEIQKSTFSKGIDIKSFSDFERSLDFATSKTMSPRERAIEAKMEGVIKVLISNGVQIEKVEAVLADARMSDQAMARIRQYAADNEKTKAIGGRIEEIAEGNRKRKIETLKARVDELELLISEKKEEHKLLKPLLSPIRLNGSKRRLK